MTEVGIELLGQLKNGSLLGPYFRAWRSLLVLETVVTLKVKVSRVHPKVQGGFYSLLGRDFSIFIPVLLFKADTNVDTQPFSVQLYRLYSYSEFWGK